MSQPAAKKIEIKQLIGLKYYDGPIAGLALIGMEKRESILMFELISWDDLQDRRVFALREMEDRSVLDQIVSLAGPPKWPVWIPNWKFSTPEAGADADAVVAQLTCQKPVITAIMCAPDSLSVSEVWAWNDLSELHRARLHQFDRTGQRQDFEDWSALYRI